MIPKWSALAAILTLTLASGAQGQGWKDRLKQKAKARVERRADEAADKGLDKAEQAITCAATDTACIDEAKAAGKPVHIEGEGSTGDAGNASGEKPLRPGEGAWVNYDFVPGDRALFVEDYSGDEVGNFPKRLEFVSGNMEVAEWQGGRYLRSATVSEFAIPLPETLPERFTLELDVYHGARRYSWGEVTIRFVERPTPANPVVEVNWTRGGLQGPTRAITEVGEKFENTFVPIRIMADGKYVKVYMGDKRVANVPNADLGRARKIWVRVPATDDSPAFVGTIRVAAGGKKLYDVLAEQGRVATQGIYFDTGSDVIRPESTPTLKEIIAMLREHEELKLTIEGHTDDVGSAQANQALSTKRAESVKAYLVSQGIDAARLEAKGLGATKPVAANTTAEGRQQNRRVELVRR